MSVSLLIITHERIAAAIVDTARSMLGYCPLQLHVLPAPGDCDPDSLREERADHDLDPATMAYPIRIRVKLRIVMVRAFMMLSFFYPAVMPICCLWRV